MGFIMKTLISAGSIALLAFLLEGIQVDGDFFYVILIAIVLSLLNSVVRPILIFLTLPATIISMGLFLLVINAVIVMLAGYFMDGFTVTSFWWALLFSILLSVVNSVMSNILKPKPEKINNDRGKVIIIDKD